MIYFWLFAVFILGAIVGSFLNVCIARLPLQKSILWPTTSRCNHCLQPIRRWDNIPLLSYWLLKGKCRSCGAPFSLQYFLVELATGLGFVGLFYLIAIVNIHRWAVVANAPGIPLGLVPLEVWIAFVHHAVLFGFLMVAVVCDLNEREIPLSVTIPGTLVGLAFAVLCPWPWPWTLPEAFAVIWNLPIGWLLPPGVVPNGPIVVRDGLYPWPVWGPIPAWLGPGTWQMGLATGVVGILVGTFLLRAVRFLFSVGRGVEGLGLGDADLMMMAGSFVGWQPVVVAFFVSVVPGLCMGIVQLYLRGNKPFSFGPALAIGVLFTYLCWPWIGPTMRPLFFDGHLLGLLAMAGCVFMLIAAVVLRLFRGKPEGDNEGEMKKAG